MRLTHSFTVPIGIDQAFDVLTDIERIAPCMPGATIESVDGDEFTGKVKVKVGPMQITYRGKARYAELDRDNHRALIDARGQETRGSGTANATITAELKEQGDETEVSVVSDLSITGRPAQFGRGVMNEVGAKLLGQFADCLSTRLTGDDEAALEGDVEDTTELTPAASSNGSGAAVSEQEVTQVAGAASPQPVTGAEPAAAATGAPASAARSGAQPAGRSGTPQTSQPGAEPIDLFGVAGPSVAKRVAPVGIAVLLLVLLWRRRRSR